MSRRWRWPRARRGTTWTTVRAQVNPPWLPVKIGHRAPPTALFTGHGWRRGSTWGTVRPQVNPPLAPQMLDNRHQRTPPFIRKFRTFDAPTEYQGAQRLTDPARRVVVSPLPVKKFRSWETLLDQQGPLPALDNRHPRAVPTRRGRTWGVVPAPVVLTAPAYPPQWLNQRQVRALQRRGRIWQVVPAQVVLTPPTWVPTWVDQRRTPMMVTRRARYGAVPGTQQGPVSFRHRPVVIVRRAGAAPRQTVPHDASRPPLRAPRRGHALRTGYQRRGRLRWNPATSGGAPAPSGHIRARVYGPSLDYGSSAVPSVAWGTQQPSAHWTVDTPTSPWAMGIPSVHWSTTQPEVKP